MLSFFCRFRSCGTLIKAAVCTSVLLPWVEGYQGVFSCKISLVEGKVVCVSSLYSCSPPETNSLLHSQEHLADTSVCLCKSYRCGTEAQAQCSWTADTQGIASRYSSGTQHVSCFPPPLTPTPRSWPPALSSLHLQPIPLPTSHQLLPPPFLHSLIQCFSPRCMEPRDPTTLPKLLTLALAIS